jgi:sodium transport system permease protein
MSRQRTWWIVYRKELRETLRDRRTLAVMVLLPLVLYPLMSVLAAEYLIAHEVSRRARPSRIVVAGPGAEDPGLHKALAATNAKGSEGGASASPSPGVTPDPGGGGAGAAREAPRTLIVTVEPKRDVDQAAGVTALGDADAIVFVPAGAAQALADDRSFEVTVYFDASSDSSRLAEERLGEALGAWSAAELGHRLEEEGLPPAFVRPVSVTSASLAPPSRVGRAEAAKTLPFVIVLMVLMGAFYPAIDLTAGEKERGTLEPLLSTPAPRRQIMAGKLGAVATISALTGVLNLVCIAGAALWIARSATRATAGGLPVGKLFGAVPWGAVALALGALLVATILFAGLMMAVASLARSFKEAQNFLTPVYLVATMPAMVSWLPGTELGYGSALVPIANVTLLLKGAVAGDLAPGPAAVALAASIGWAAAAVALAARIYDSERLLFAPEQAPGGGGPGVWARLLRRRDDDLVAPGRAAASERRERAPAPAAQAEASPVSLEPGVAMALFGGCAVLLFGPGAELQAMGIGGVALSLWLCLALPVVVVARVRGGVVTGLGLSRPSGRSLLGGVLVGVSGWIVLATLVLPIQEALFPTPKALEQALQGLVAPAASLWVTVLAVAVSPAVCEELLCRGAVARALDRPLGRIGAIVVSALLFGALHMSAYRFVPTFLLGLALAQLTLSARSTWPAMIAHALNNGSVVLLSTSMGLSAARAIEGRPWIVGVPALLVLGVGFALARAPSARGSAPCDAGRVEH